MNTTDNREVVQTRQQGFDQLPPLMQQRASILSNAGRILGIEATPTRVAYEIQTPSEPVSTPQIIPMSREVVEYTAKQNESLNLEAIRSDVSKIPEPPKINIGSNN